MSRPQTIRGKDDSGKPGLSRPIEIPTERRTGADKGRGYAASCPTFRPLPPPPPSTRPQVPSVEPPPLDLPPSPSTFSDELKDGSPEEPQTGGVAVVSATAKNADRATRNYARSLMLSSSMPTTSFLDSYKWQTVREDPESPRLYDDDTKEDGEDEKEESPTNANISPVAETRAKSGSVSGRGRLNSTAEDGVGSVTGRRPINIAHSANTADDLSKSPTVLSLLQSNSFTNSPQVQYRSSRATHMATRASVMTKPREDEEEDTAPAEDNTNDDLQFSISLNENDDSYLDAGDEAFS